MELNLKDANQILSKVAPLVNEVFGKTTYSIQNEFNNNGISRIELESVRLNDLQV